MKTHLFFPKIYVILCLVGCAFSVNAQTVSISNETELKAIANNLSANYRLTNDIVLTGEWTPIGKEKPFSGILDGNNFVIRNLKITDGTGNVGLFAQTDGAMIKKLGIENAQITAPKGTAVGIIVGRAVTTYIDDSYISESKVEGSNVGSFIGIARNRNINFTVINNSYSSAEIKSASYAGGIIGSSEGAHIENSYFSGSIEAATLCGGITASSVGENSITNCLVLSSGLQGQETDPLIVKRNGSLELDNNYEEKGGTLLSCENNTPLNDVQAKSADFYKNHLYWDTSRWSIRDGFYPVPIGFVK